MFRLFTKNATGVAPDGRWYAGDINAIQDAVAAINDLTQALGVGTISLGESGLQFVRYGAGEARLTGAMRTDGILRALGGLYAGAFTTAQRDAIAVGFRPYGLVILNTTTNRYEWNLGTDAVPDWQPINGLVNNVIITSLINDGAITTAKLAASAVTTNEIANGTIVDADINAAAAIAKSKLAGLSIVDADINAAAAIAKSKLAALSIVDADVNAAAAIAKSKLAALNIVDADVNAAAAIAMSKLKLCACSVFSSGTLGVNNTTWTTVAWNQEEFDTDNIHDNVTNNSRLTCKTAGNYLAWGTIDFGTNVTGGRQSALAKNGSRISPYFGGGTVGSAGVAVRAPGLYAVTLAVNDYLEFHVYQDSGGSITAQGINFGMAKIG